MALPLFWKVLILLVEGGGLEKGWNGCLNPGFLHPISLALLEDQLESLHHPRTV